MWNSPLCLLCHCALTRYLDAPEIRLIDVIERRKRTNPKIRGGMTAFETLLFFSYFVTYLSSVYGSFTYDAFWCWCKGSPFLGVHASKRLQARLRRALRLPSAVNVRYLLYLLGTRSL